jgi:hypothetical protein
MPTNSTRWRCPLTNCKTCLSALGRSASDRLHVLPPYLIVIDELDAEVDDRGGLAFLQALLTTIEKQGLKFFVASQDFSSDVVCCLHKIAEEDVGADILRYLDAELPLLDKCDRAELAR